MSDHEASIGGGTLPCVTAIITTFNRRAFLGNAIDSVLAQSLTDFELIILDNDSSDGTDALVSGYTDPRIRYRKHRAMGIAEQRNLGVDLARGEFIAFLDDDDVWLPCKLEAQYRKFLNSDGTVGLVYGGFVFYDDAGREWGTHVPRLRGSILEPLLWANDPFTGSASNPMLRKSTVVNVGGYDPRVKVGEDWELYLRLAKRYRVEFTTDVVLRIRQHSGARLGDKVDAALATERHAYVRYLRPMSNALKSRYLRTMGGKCIRLGRSARGRRFLALAIVLNPRNIYAYIQSLLSFFSPASYRHFHRLYRKYLRS